MTVKSHSEILRFCAPFDYCVFDSYTGVMFFTRYGETFVCFMGLYVQENATTAVSRCDNIVQSGHIGSYVACALATRFQFNLRHANPMINRPRPRTVSKRRRNVAQQPPRRQQTNTLRTRCASEWPKCIPISRRRYRLVYFYSNIIIIRVGTRVLVPN